MPRIFSITRLRPVRPAWICSRLFPLLVAVAILLLQSPATAQTTSGTSATGNTLFNSTFNCHSCHIAASAPRFNAINAGGHIAYANTQGMGGTGGTAQNYADIAAYLATLFTDLGTQAVAYQTASAFIIPNIALGTTYGSLTGLQTVSGPSKGSVSYSGTTATYTPSAGQTGADSFTYRAVRAGGSTNTRTVNLSIAAAPAPNDNFANRIALNGGIVSTTGSNTTATKEAGEPNHALNTGGHSVWWTWTASSSTPVTIDTIGSNFDTLLGVYIGSAVNALTQIAANDDINGASNRQSSVTFTAVAGTTYQIAVDGFSSATGSITLNLNQPLQTLTVIPLGTGSGTVSSAPAGISCGGTCTANLPTNSAVTLTATANAGSVLVGIGGQSTSPYSFTLTGGTTVYANFYALTNDDFANRTVINPFFPSGSGYNIGATLETGEPSHGVSGAHSVWWTWTAPSTGAWRLSLAGSNFDTLLDVYTGTSVNALTQVAHDDDYIGSLQSTLTFYAVAGTVYSFAVDGYNGASGYYQFNFTKPGNDNFIDRLTLSGGTVNVTDYSVNATRETGEPSILGNVGGHSQWWSWTAPITGPVSITTVGSNFDTILGVYTGFTLTPPLTLVAQDDDSGGNLTSAVNFSGTLGTTYQIAVDGFGGASGNVTLNIVQQQPQTISSFTSPSAQNFSTTPITLIATATSMLPVTFTSFTPLICTISGSSLTIVATGMCSIDAEQAGNASYFAATAVLRNFLISQSPQSITFGAQPAALFSNGSTIVINPDATASSSLPVTYSIASSGICSYAGGSNFTMLAVGTCAVTASQAGNANYLAAAPVTVNVVINPGPQTITFPMQLTQRFSVGSFAINPAAAASSGLPVVYGSTTPGVCTVSGATVNIVATGSCIVAANQAGNANFNPAAQVTQSIAITAAAPAAPTIGTATPGDAQATIAFTPSANSGGSPLVTFRATCNPGTVFANGTVSPITVMGLVNGTAYLCSVTATNAAMLTSAASATVSVTPTGIPVAPAISSASAITFNVLTPGSFAVTATGTPAPTLTSMGTLPAGVSFTPVPGSATLAGTPASGTVGNYPLTITAMNASGTVMQSFTLTVQKSGQTITFNNPGAQSFSGMPLTISATTTSMLTVTFSSSTPSTCTVSGASVTLLTVGSCTIVASQIGDANFNAAPQITQSFSVGASAQSITFNAQTTASRAYTPSGMFAISPLASASSGLTVTYSSTSPAICSASGSNVTMLAAGTCTIAANQAGDANFAAATQVARIISITPTAPGVPTIGAATAGNAQATISFTAPVNTGGSAITQYTATCGALTGSAMASPITVMGLTNGTSYSCTVTTTNAAALTSLPSTGVMVTPISTAGSTTWAGICSSCHGITPSGTHVNAGGTTATVLNYVILNQPTMNSNSNVTNLTQIDRAAVAAYILNALPAIRVSTPNNTPLPIDVAGTLFLNSISFTDIEVVTPPVNGTLSAFSGTSVTYTPTPGFNGTDSFSYRGKRTVPAMLTGDPRAVNITVLAASPTITSAATASGIYGQAFSYQIAATTLPTLYGASGLPTGVTVNTANGLISGAPVVTGLFNALITASNDGGIGSSTLAITIGKAGQIISFPTQVALTRSFSPGGIFPINPTASGGGSASAVTNSSATPGVCSVSTTTVTIITAGSCTIAANQLGDANYNAAAPATQSVTITPIAPGPPVIGTATPGNGSGSIAFTPPTATGGSPVASYTVTCNNGAVPASSGASPITVTGLVIGTQYTCTVTANGAGGTSLPSGSVIVTPVAVVPPGAPTIGTATAGSTQAVIAFTPPVSDGGGAIIDYAATCNPGSVRGINNVSPVTVMGLVNGTAYNCSVTARNVAGSGPSSTSVAVTPLPTLALSGVVSRKTHGAAGSFDIVINSATLIGGLIDIEPRAIGSGHTLVFTFNNPITAAGSVSVTDAASMPVGSASAMRSGNDVVVTLAGTPDNQRVTVTLTNVNGTVPPITASLGFLIGDVNNTRSVNASDINGVKARSGKPTDVSNFRFDLNSSGDITSSDISAVKARSGATLAP